MTSRNLSKNKNYQIYEFVKTYIQPKLSGKGFLTTSALPQK